MVLSEALGDLRDSLTEFALLLKDRVADTPSLKRDEMMVQAERHLTRIKGGCMALLSKSISALTNESRSWLLYGDI
jgi:hypothetical protein